MVDLSLGRGWGYIVSTNSYGYELKNGEALPIMFGPTYGEAAQNLYNLAGSYQP